MQKSGAAKNGEGLVLSLMSGGRGGGGGGGGGGGMGNRLKTQHSHLVVLTAGYCDCYSTRRH